MPVRTSSTPNTHTKDAIKVMEEVVNVDFLPEHLTARIYDTLDSYFGLGGFKATIQKVAADKMPDFPNQITSTSSEQLGNFLAEHTAWYAYTNEKLRYIVVAQQVVESEMEQALDTALVQIASENPSRGGLTENERKSKARLDGGYLALLHYRNRIAGVRQILDNQSKTFDKTIASLSREVSRRERTNGFD